ncbi:MAG: AAA family ATPase [Acutalibacteraceae bacterium]|mgnify:FL=1|nr:AAA family ATPase [Acutalibacteraceae bacterium]HIR03444.1 AAA family ATPase [Candidatus Scatovicinus merdipullorum]
MSKILVVTSGKGGTGKSTIAVSLGNALVKRNKKVLLIDCDSGMRGLDIMLGISKSLVFDIADAISGNCQPEHIIYPCPYSDGLFLIPAPQNAQDELSGSVFTQFVSRLENAYDYIIIDSPAGVGKGFETAVAPAQLCLVVANAEPTSVRGCANVKKRLSELGKQNVRLVINRFSRTGFKELGVYEDLDAVIDQTGIQLIGIVTENRQVVYAIQKGLSYTGRCTALKAVDNLAARIDGEARPLAVY